MRNFLYIIVLACVFMGFCACNNAKNEAPFEVLTIENKTINLNDRYDRVLVILSSTEKCHQCFKEVSACINIWKKSAKSEIKVVSLIYVNGDGAAEKQQSIADMKELLTVDENYFTNINKNRNKYIDKNALSPALFLLKSNKVATLPFEKMFSDGVDMYKVITGFLDENA